MTTHEMYRYPRPDRTHRVPAIITTDAGEQVLRTDVLKDRKLRAEHIARATLALETWLQDHSDIIELEVVWQMLRTALDAFEATPDFGRFP